MRLVSLALCLLLVGGCVKSINPVLKDEQVREFPQLAGKWVAADNTKSQVEVTPEGKQFRATFVDEDGETGEYVMRVGTVGDLTIAEFRPAKPADTAKAPAQIEQMVRAYTFVVLTATEPAVRVRAIKPERLESYIKAGELPVAGSDENEVIVASTEQLQAVIQKLWPVQEAWTEELVFVRPDAVPAK